MEEIEKDMRPKLIGETWRKYPTETSKQKVTYGLFECQYCGEEFEALLSNVKRGRTKSCGCYAREVQTTHGLTSHRFYKTWYGMLQRCNNPKIKAYKDYGARGITVCGEWLDVRNFVDWAESTYPNMGGYTLDRIDNAKGYSPENCRWADKTTQVVNQRMRRTNTSGFVGVNWKKDKNIWGVNIKHHKVLKYVGGFKTIEDAILARDNYIIENNLPHKLSSEY